MTMNAYSLSQRKPYRVDVFAQGFRPVRRRRNRTDIELAGYGYQLWQSRQDYTEARLPNAGSFLFAGLHEVRRAAMAELSKAGVHQVAIKTNQDRCVYRYFKLTDGRITGYVPDPHD